VLDLEPGGVMNIKINVKFYTGLGHWNVIPYVQCWCMCPLFTLVRLIEEFVIGEITNLRVLREVFVLLVVIVFLWVRECPSAYWATFL
jgi:hypothetical protein